MEWNEMVIREWNGMKVWSHSISLRGCDKQVTSESNSNPKFAINESNSDIIQILLKIGYQYHSLNFHQNFGEN